MAFEAWSAPNEVTKRKARAYSGFQALCDSTGTIPDMVQCTALLAQLEGRRGEHGYLQLRAERELTHRILGAQNVGGEASLGKAQNTKLRQHWLVK